MIYPAQRITNTPYLYLKTTVMQHIHIPQGYQQVMTYLILDEPEKFFAFTKTVFDATEKSRHNHEDGSLLHGEIQIGGVTIMFGGSAGKWPAMTAGLFVYVANADESYRKALEAGGSSVMELSDQDYGRTCGVQDPCGNTWWITQL